MLGEYLFRYAGIFLSESSPPANISIFAATSHASIGAGYWSTPLYGTAIANGCG